MKKVYKSKIGITGSSGVLGRFFIKNFKSKYLFKSYKGRLENFNDLKKWINKNSDIEILLHFGGIVSIKKADEDKKKTFLINSISSIKLLKLINNSKIKKLRYFLFASTSHVYKSSYNNLNENSLRLPKTVYGKSKKKVEDFIIKNRNKFYFDIGIARIFNFYSKHQQEGFFIPDIKKKILQNKKTISIMKINTNRDYINIDQLSEILMYMIQKKTTKPLNVGSGRKINLVNLVNLINKKFKGTGKLIFEKKLYAGLISSIKLLRKVGYKKKINRFIF